MMRGSARPLRACRCIPHISKELMDWIGWRYPFWEDHASYRLETAGQSTVNHSTCPILRATSHRQALLFDDDDASKAAAIC